MKRLKILAADDGLIIRLGLRALLADVGHEVLQGSLGREALHVVRTASPDPAPPHIRLPLPHALEAARTIAREHPVSILILTAFRQ